MDLWKLNVLIFDVVFTDPAEPVSPVTPKSLLHVWHPLYCLLGLVDQIYLGVVEQNSCRTQIYPSREDHRTQEAKYIWHLLKLSDCHCLSYRRFPAKQIFLPRGKINMCIDILKQQPSNHQWINYKMKLISINFVDGTFQWNRIAYKLCLRQSDRLRLINSVAPNPGRW